MHPKLKNSIFFKTLIVYSWISLYASQVSIFLFYYYSLEINKNIYLKINSKIFTKNFTKIFTSVLMQGKRRSCEWHTVTSPPPWIKNVLGKRSNCFQCYMTEVNFSMVYEFVQKSLLQCNRNISSDAFLSHYYSNKKKFFSDVNFSNISRMITRFWQ